MKVKNFLIDFFKGAAMGVGVIIPGVSGGTIAVLLNIYDKLISAVSGLFKNFKQSVLTLLPIISGLVIAVAAAYFPIKYALKYIPFPTVMLFAGLMAGSCPSIFKEGIKREFKWYDSFAIILSLGLVIGICFIPNLGNADLTTTMPVYGYFLIIAVGALASCALVVPGISGSMLLLILGYYNSVLGEVSNLKDTFGHSFLVLALFGIGILIGFFSIAQVMKLLLKKFPRTTYWAIIGFVVGSVPAIFITYNSNFPEYEYNVLATSHIVVGCVLAVGGATLSYFLTALAEHKKRAAVLMEQRVAEDTPEDDAGSPDAE